MSTCDCGLPLDVSTTGHAIGCSYEWQNLAALENRPAQVEDVA